ncbi:MAG: AGE family epimerase/isomerase, partial [Planctomycetales bacterium]|nr:AGE family epimerase/isomerase [Planctomycetales bacterium]
MDSTQRRQLENTYRDGLLLDVLPFWIKHGVDHKCGGFLTALDRDGAVIDTDKGVWQQGRFTWLLGELCNCDLLRDHPARDQWLQLAEHGAAFLSEHCFDPVDGRMWFQV